MLLPALVLGGIFDFVGIHSHLAPALYSGHVSNHMQVNVTAALTVRNFVGSMFFTQGILVHFFGSNGALWSLANEFWYYILFPCGLLALRRDSSLPVRLVHAVIFVVCAWFAGKAILLLFPVWLMGSALAALRASESRGGARLLAAAIYIPLFFFIAKTHLIQGIVSDYLLGIATAIFLTILLGAKSEAPPALWARCSRVTARFSYTLYLVHGPLLGLLGAATVHDSRWQPQASHLVIALLELALVIAFAFVVGLVTEFQTDKVRGWIESRVLLARERPVELSRAG